MEGEMEGGREGGGGRGKRKKGVFVCVADLCNS